MPIPIIVVLLQIYHPYGDFEIYTNRTISLATKNV